ncbi:MAG: hypothetical protein EOS00_30085 [Mesorhizobium sp.]|nr:MAG: hypothetical protein EOR81_30380 [Mesorhizobium sp.]RWN53669.1 MAG: hypothetical protein EOS00_30085 [Mesorhizobium sp.]
MAAVIGLLASSGLRSGGVVRLDRSDVDLSNRILLVRKTKSARIVSFQLTGPNSPSVTTRVSAVRLSQGSRTGLFLIPRQPSVGERSAKRFR